MGSVILVMTLIGVGVLVAMRLFVRRTSTTHRAFTSDEVEFALEQFLDLTEGSTHDDWDLFLGWPVDDPYLESVRQKCLTIVRDSGSVPAEINPQNRDRISEILRELRLRKQLKE